MDTKIVKLRRIKRSDLPYFLKWWQDKTLISLTSGLYENSKNILKGYFLEMLKTKNNRYYIIICNNKIIGNISLIRKNQDTFELQIVIGEKKYWGKGIGYLAIERLLRIAFTMLGYKKAYLEVRPENLRAIKLYKKCGFIENGMKQNKKNGHQPVVLKMILTGKKNRSRSSNWSGRKMLPRRINR